MKMATGGVVRTALIWACVTGSMGTACAQSGSTRAGDGGLGVTSPSGNMNGAGQRARGQRVPLSLPRRASPRRAVSPAVAEAALRLGAPQEPPTTCGQTARA